MKKRVLKIVVGVVVVCVLLGSAGLGIAAWGVHQGAREYCRVAQQAHPHTGDDVAALIDFMSSDSHPMRERNRAVWTLGRLRDAQALPAFERVHTGAPCNHDRDLCQYELEKAIRLCGGSPNPPRKPKH